jgi:hypothetical protein
LRTIPIPLPKTNQDRIVGPEKLMSSDPNTGIGVVIPVEKILETLDQPEIVEMRKKAGDELRKANGATADFAKRGADATPSRGANPKG